MNNCKKLFGALCIASAVSTASAEGVFQMGISSPQPLERRTVVFVHANTVNEFIRVHLCLNEGESSNVFADIYSTSLVDGQYQLDTKLADLESDGANIACDSLMDSPLPATPVIGDTMQFQVPSAGVYGISFDDQTSDQKFDRWDISMASSATSAVDPTANDGNVFSYQWDFFTASFEESAAATTQMFILVPGGFPNTNYVWALDLQGFSGNRYDISANDIGLDAPLSGLSAPKDDLEVSEKYPIYLSYPTGASPSAPPTPEQIPVLTDTFEFTDDAGNDDVISPDGDDSEETGKFTFTSDVSGTYAITIDINRDGDFGIEDRLFLGTMEADTLTEVTWDGLDSEGNEIAAARYDTRLQLRVGEYHFVADDAETSGGGTDNGLTIFQALADDSLLPTRVFWDDQTLLDGTTTLPNGELSAEDEVGSYRHTWGSFVEESIGNDSFIDTYVFGNANTYTSTLTVSYGNAPQITSNGGGLEALIVVDEDIIDVTTVTASGGTGDYSFTLLGEDADLFSLTPAGLLGFSAPTELLLSEDFGSGSFPGPELPAGVTNQIYNVPLQPADFPEVLNDGEYVRATNAQQGFSSWASVSDNTPGDGNQGYMFLVNADDNDAGEFYRSRITLSSNTKFELLMSAINVNGQGDFDFCEENEGGLILPNVTLQVQDLDNNVLASTDTGDIAFDPNPEWQQYSLGFSKEPDTTDIQLVLINNSVGGCGNDLAIDDIIFGIPLNVDANRDTVSVSVAENTSVQEDVIFVGANDTLDGESLTGTEVYSVAPDSSVPAGLIFDTTTGGVTIAAGTPAGTLSFDYQVCETIDEFNCDIATVTVNNADPDFENPFGSIEYDVVVEVDDGVRSTQQAITVRVQEQNEAPVATAQTITVIEDTATAVTIAGTDTDGFVDSFTAITDPTNGSLSGTAPNLTYTPNSNFAGADSFTFSVVDDDGAVSSSALVSITVISDNDAPTATMQTLDIAEGFAAAVTLTGSDADGDDISFELTSSPSNGTLTGTAPNLTYTPADDFLGSDSFSFVTNDGELDSTAATITINVLGDLDGDMVPDINDNDDDGDGIEDSVEGSGDPDGDMIPNSRDPDSDGDGRLDSEEGVVDTDRDGTPDYLDTSLDEDMDGIPDIIEGTNDDDNDGLANFLDLDSDRDGLPDALEALSAITPTGTDADFDGIDDAADIDITGGMDENDNGIDDAFEPIDTDGDGAPDYIDPDSDNDGIPDAVEAPLIPLSGMDSDLDGIDDLLDVDQTGGDDQNADGVDDEFAPIDTDRDGLPDYRDIDTDNDGIIDSVEADVSGDDTDADGIDDLFDVDQTGGTDANNDGVDDDVPATDTDSDGVPDYRDLDSDNDTLSDVIESGLGDIDGNGFSDAGETTDMPQNVDLDSQPDFRDLDSDNDGTSDIEGAGNIGLDADEDGTIDAPMDTDGDGIADVVDREPGQFGSSTDTDTDGDGILNRDDLDDDNDGIQDTLESIGVPELSGLDTNGNNIDDAIDAALTGGADANNDGIDDALDGDTDNDGIRDSLDLDSDNDGIADINESGFDGVADTDRDGVIDNVVDADENGLDDRIAVSLDPLNTDAADLPDFQDLDSDNDSLSDLIESGLATALDANQDGVLDTLLDADLDGILDLVDADITGAASGTPPPISDTDGDGEPDYRDLDSDGDGFLDAIENADFDNNGVPDALQNDDGALETAVSGVGSVQLWMIGFLTMLVLLRKSGAWVKPSTVAMFSVFCASTFLGSYSKPAYAGSASECGKQGDDSFNRCFYLGAGLGLSHLDPEGQVNGWSTNDSNSSGYEIHFGQKVTPHWFWELSYVEAGEAGLGNVNPALETLISDAVIEYQVPSLFAGYTLWDKDAGFNLYGKVGVSSIGTSASDDRIGQEDQTSVQLAFGAGAQYRFHNSPWFAQLQLDSFDRDAKFLSLRLSRYFGSPKRSTKTKVAPVVAAPVVAAVVPTAVDNQASELSVGMMDDDFDGVVNELDQCPSTAPNVLVNDQGCAVFDGVIEGVNFETNKAILTAEAMRVLDGSAETLLQFPQVRVEVQAHTDSQGAAAYNQNLSQARATSVVNYLVGKGVSMDRLVAQGYGETRPIATNETPEGRASNRRVELSVIK